MSIETLEFVRDQVQKGLEKAIEDATSVVDDYWLEFRMTNKRLLSEQANSTDGTYNRGNIAPRIVTRSGKAYVEWVFYGPGRYGARKQNWGDRIAPRKGPRYHQSQFEKKAQPWELDLIMETENKLRPLRYAIERTHSTLVYLNKILKVQIAAEEAANAELKESN